jgi:hypothetical protein
MSFGQLREADNALVGQALRVLRPTANFGLLLSSSAVSTKTYCSV